MLPAGQRLGSHQPVVAGGELGLEQDLDLVALQRGA
jgi:hypothetical protein